MWRIKKLCRYLKDEAARYKTNQEAQANPYTYCGHGVPKKTLINRLMCEDDTRSLEDVESEIRAYANDGFFEYFGLGGGCIDLGLKGRRLLKRGWRGCYYFWSYAYDANPALGTLVVGIIILLIGTGALTLVPPLRDWFLSTIGL